ncbi:MAG: diguanylate cyclase [Candidatus Omnitrophica bacterium]|nr:diguanylate cyclase [Candidatus Omnitrophota bacterium]
MATNVPAQSGTLLLVDDEPVILDSLCAILREEGYTVHAAQSGAEAMRLSERQEFDLAIIDLKLPDIDGTSVLRVLKQNCPDICAILITAYPTTESAIRAVLEEAYEYVTKPFDVSHVKLLIKRGLKERALLRENKQLVLNLQKEKEKLQTVLQIGHVLNSILNLDELAQCIVRQIAGLLGARTCSLMLRDEEDMLTIAAAIGLEDLVIQTTRVAMGESISGWAAKEGKPVVVTNIEEDMHFGRTNLPQYQSKSLLCIPLKIKDRVIGVINATDRLEIMPVPEFSEEEARFIGLVCNYAAIALENAQLYGEVKNLAITDGLTELYNHRYFQTQLTAEVLRVQRYPHPLALIMFDIDFFKEFNDTYGHPLGDLVLQQIAKTIRKAVRKVDIPCRYGGEEFAVILPETRIGEAVTVAEKIRQSIDELKFETGTQRHYKKMTVSGGVAEFKKSMSKEDFVTAADKALYQAKSGGKNRICVA